MANVGVGYHQYFDAIWSPESGVRQAESALRTIEMMTGSRVFDSWRVLEIGAGTGRHTRQLLRSVHVDAVEPDANLLAQMDDWLSVIGRPEQERLSRIHGVITDAPNRMYDAVLALGDVVNRLMTRRELDGFLEACVRRMKQTTPLIIELWNGVAAMIDPPHPHKVQRARVNGCDVLVWLKTTMDVLQETAQLDYTLLVDGPHGHEESVWGFENRLWTPRVLSEAMIQAGLTVMPWCVAYDYATPLHADDRTMMLVGMRE